MQRWFFADEPEPCDVEVEAEQSVQSSSSSAHKTAAIEERMWRFCVRVRQTLAPNERVAVVGSCNSLGMWQFKDCRLMANSHDDTQIWMLYADIWRDLTTEYRYMVVAIDPATNQTIVRSWETHLKPRNIKPGTQFTLECHEIYGEFMSVRKVDRGWLTSETIIQLKFIKSPFQWKQRMRRRVVNVKVTPMYLKLPGRCEVSPLGSPHINSPFDETLSSDMCDSHDNTETELSTAFAFNEVAALRPGECNLGPQAQFGTACGPEDVIILHLTIGDFANTVYLIDLFTYDSKADTDEPPYHLGYHYLMPSLFKHSQGSLDVPITCATRHRPIGMMHLGYLIMRPYTGAVLDMSVSYTRYWNDKWVGLDVGHRGLGPTFMTDDSVIRENTVTSLKNAAEHGADMVEFDVQLSKDLVPVIYHDFMIYVSMKSKCEQPRKHDFLMLPLRELTLEQLRSLKVYETKEGKTQAECCYPYDDMAEYQPFPELAELLDVINPHVGFNIEVKWPQRLEDGTWEENFAPVVDQNEYMDRILDVVFQHVGNRRIVFSTFDADSCALLRFKQNRFPVMFLTLGQVLPHDKYLDPRGNTIQLAMLSAIAMELLGIVSPTPDLLKDTTLINIAKGSGLVVFCWGRANNDPDIIRQLKSMGLHAIIYDKMHINSTKDVKQSVFFLRANEQQREELTMQALEIGDLTNYPCSSSSDD